MVLRVSIIALILFASCALSGQAIQGVSLDSLSDLMKKEKRPVAIFMHTSWCKYCKHMEVSTFEDEKVKKILEKKFYFARLDGEHQESIHFFGQVFPPDQRNHTLARALSDEEKGVSYPSFVLLNSDLEITFRNSGYISSKDLETVLVKTLLHSVDE